MELLQLKNGAEITKPFFMQVIKKLDTLFVDDWAVFYELVQKCRDPQDEIWGIEAKHIIEKLQFMRNGIINPDIKNIVLAQVEGTDCEVYLSSKPAVKFS